MNILARVLADAKHDLGRITDEFSQMTTKLEEAARYHESKAVEAAVAAEKALAAKAQAEEVKLRASRLADRFKELLS